MNHMKVVVLKLLSGAGATYGEDFSENHLDGCDGGLAGRHSAELDV